MKKVRAKIHEEKSIYIHNDLSNAAYYFRKRIDERAKAGDRDGIALEMMACLILSAFTIEAKINFLGYKTITDWKERESLIPKIKQIGEIFGLECDFGKRPYQTIRELLIFRDTLAHGKPVEIDRGKIVALTHEQLQEVRFPDADWEKFLTEKFVTIVSDDIDQIWKQMLECSELKIFNTLTQGSTSISIID